MYNCLIKECTNTKRIFKRICHIWKRAKGILTTKAEAEAEEHGNDSAHLSLIR
jgi:hypothetical protein